MVKSKKKKSKAKTEKKKGYGPIIRFCVIFFVLLIVITFLYSYGSGVTAPVIMKLEVLTAIVTGFVLKVVGMTAEVSGKMIYLSNFSVEVIGECTGLFEMLIFLAALIAYPANYKKKLLGCVLGIPFIYIINIIRMAFISVVANWAPKTFDFLHVYFWQVAMIFIIMAAWILWIQKVVYYERKTVVIHR
ncbi:MAG: exosortase H [Candidatus Zixiibacteriota bacterium]